MCAKPAYCMQVNMSSFFRSLLFRYPVMSEPSMVIPSKLEALLAIPMVERQRWRRSLPPWLLDIYLELGTTDSPAHLKSKVPTT